MPVPPFTVLAESLPETVPFVGPEALQRRSGVPLRARIGANESGFGPSPNVLAAITAAATDIWAYPDPEGYDLRAALAANVGSDPDEVVLGEGIDGLMGLAVRLFIAPGDTFVTSLGAYPTLNYHVAGFGGAFHYVPYRGVHEDLDALAARARETNARMVYLANPDNPMGSFWPAADVMRFADALPQTCLLLLDEAYGETAPPGVVTAVDTSRPNVLWLRTFSKAYGLAGIRVGYAMGNRRLVRAFERVRNHFGVNRLAQAAGLAALKDQAYLHQAVQAIADARTRIAAIAQANGLRPLSSGTNFVAVDCERDAAFAAAVLAGLARQGVFIRKPMSRGLDHHIRISAAPHRELDILAEALPIAINEA